MFRKLVETAIATPTNQLHMRLGLQPIIPIDAVGKEFVPAFYEALSRLHHNGDRYPAGVWIDSVSADYDLIQALDWWSIKSVVKIAAKTQHIRYAVNIDGRTLRDTHFVRQLGMLLSESNVRPSQIVLEVTEREALTQHARHAIDTLASTYTVLLDDVVAMGDRQGFMHLLLRLPFDGFKIDGELVRAIADEQRGEEARILLEALLQIASRLETSRGRSFLCICEHVSDQCILETLRKCQETVAPEYQLLVQGFHVGSEVEG